MMHILLLLLTVSENIMSLFLFELSLDDETDIEVMLLYFMVSIIFSFVEIIPFVL